MAIKGSFLQPSKHIPNKTSYEYQCCSRVKSEKTLYFGSVFSHIQAEYEHLQESDIPSNPCH